MIDALRELDGQLSRYRYILAYRLSLVYNSLVWVRSYFKFEKTNTKITKFVQSLRGANIFLQSGSTQVLLEMCQLPTHVPGKQILYICSSADSSRRRSASLRNILVSCFFPLRYTIHDLLFTLDFVASTLSTVALWKGGQGNSKKSPMPWQIY